MVRRRCSAARRSRATEAARLLLGGPPFLGDPP
jgi:hypothetical protein